MTTPIYQKILYATDLTPRMKPVFSHAIGVAKQYGGKIIMLHVVEPLGQTGRALIDHYAPNLAERLEHEGLQEILDQMKRRLRAAYVEELGSDGKDSHLVSDILVVSGHSAEAINHQAERLDVDLIVIGTHTDNSLGHRLLGSTARRLTHDATRPIMVVPVPPGAVVAD